jgi:uncharacterized membrane protein YkvA (DUF1232 family)
MKEFDEILLESIREYEGRHDDLIYQAPAMYRLLTNLLDDPRLPARLRPIVLCAIAYFILPADVIPENLEGQYGYLDDIWLCAFVADRIRKQLGDSILTANWDGESPVLKLLEDILAPENNLLEGKEKLVLDYIGFSQNIDAWSA